MTELVVWFRESVTGKLLFIGLLVIVLLIPLGMIESQIAERGRRADEAAREVANSWGGYQTIGGPILVFARETARPPSLLANESEGELYALPSRLTVDVVAESQALTRGIYEIPIYTASVRMSGSLAAPAGFDGSSSPRWDDALLSVPVSDPRSIREPVTITVGDTTAEFAAGGERVAGLGPQLVVPMSELGIEALDGEIEFEMAFRIGGTAKLMFLPFGDSTTVTLQADWPSPSFGGGYLPDTRSVSSSGFDASWSVLSLGRGYPSVWSRSDLAELAIARRIWASAFGVDLIVPIGVHQASLRAVKYAVLFLSLTFLAFFMFELFTPIRLHAVQYLLVGLANSLFYLLLIAFAEHAGFIVAYVVSAVPSISLIGGYSAAVLGSNRRALPVVALLTLIYGYLFLVLRLEDYALVSGSIGLFFVLACGMYATRRIDWDAVGFPSARSARADS